MMLGRRLGLRFARLWMAALFVAAAAAPAVGQAPLVVEYYHVDAVGSVRAVTNQAGAVIRSYDYSPFGELESSNCTASEDSRLYTGQERDKETCLDYFGARYYRSTSGRFLTIDPVLDREQSALDPQLWNRYSYARNNPTRYVDPDGRWFWELWDFYSVAASAYSVYQDPSSAGNWLAFGLDVVGAALPVVPAVGGLVRVGPDVVDAASQGRAVIGKLTDISAPGSLGSSEHTLLQHMSDLGSPRANWQQNSTVLRTEMNKGVPIRDASVDPATGALINNTGFLRAERNLLDNRGWTYSPQTRVWSPATSPR